MRARVRFRGLAPIIGKGRGARELDVIPWDTWDQFGGYYVLRDEAGRILLLEGKKAKVELATMRERRVAGKAWRRALERAWREEMFEATCDARSDITALRLMSIVSVSCLVLIAWVFLPGLVSGLRSGTLPASIVINIIGMAVMMAPLLIATLALRDTSFGWSPSMPRLIHLTRAGVAYVDGHGREHARDWSACKGVGMRFGAMVRFQDGNRVLLLGLGARGHRVLGWVRDDIDASAGRPKRRSRTAPLLLALCVIHGLGMAASAAMSGSGQGAIPWGRVALGVVVGTLAPAALCAILFFGTRAVLWWERQRRIRRRRRSRTS